MKVFKTEEALLVLTEIVFDSIKFTVGEGWDASPDDLSKSHRKDLRGLLDELNLRLTSFIENLTPDNDQKHRTARVEPLKVAANSDMAYHPFPHPSCRPALEGDLGTRERGYILMNLLLGERWRKKLASALPSNHTEAE